MWFFLPAAILGTIAVVEKTRLQGNLRVKEFERQAHLQVQTTDKFYRECSRFDDELQNQTNPLKLTPSQQPCVERCLNFLTDLNVKRNSGLDADFIHRRYGDRIDRIVRIPEVQVEYLCRNPVGWQNVRHLARWNTEMTEKHSHLDTTAMRRALERIDKCVQEGYEGKEYRKWRLERHHSERVAK